MVERSSAGLLAQIAVATGVDQDTRPEWHKEDSTLNHMGLSRVHVYIY